MRRLKLSPWDIVTVRVLMNYWQTSKNKRGASKKPTVLSRTRSFRFPGKFYTLAVYKSRETLALKVSKLRQALNMITLYYEFRGKFRAFQIPDPVTVLNADYASRANYLNTRAQNVSHSKWSSRQTSPRLITNCCFYFRNTFFEIHSIVICLYFDLFN